MMAVRELTDSINSVSVIAGRRRKRAGFGKGVSMKLFKYAIDIGFRHCDPAGIVFYPRYFEMMNDAIEIFFRVPVTTVRGAVKEGPIPGGSFF